MRALRSVHPSVPIHPTNAVEAPPRGTIILHYLGIALLGWSRGFHQPRRLRGGPFNLQGERDEAPLAGGIGEEDYGSLDEVTGGLNLC
jgi:hypothetical protein